jgi:Amt family ammonium transporter
MAAATNLAVRQRRPRLRDASLLEAPSILASRIRGIQHPRTLTWLACIPVALFGLGLFNLSAHAAQLPELTPGFLINNLGC